MARYQACSDLYMPDGTYIQAGTTFDGPEGWKPPCHAVNFLDGDGAQALWNVGPMFSEVEPFRALYTNGGRWTGVPVPGMTAQWVRVPEGYVLKGAEGLGPKPA